MNIEITKIYKKWIYSILETFLLFCTLTSVVSASVSYDTFQNTIDVQNEQCINITGICKSIGNDSIIKSVGEKIWLVNACIHSDNSTIYINNSDVSELRLTGNIDKNRILVGYKERDIFRIHDVTITGWNGKSGTPEIVGGILLYDSELQDTVVKYSAAIRIYNNSIGDVSNLTIKSSSDLWIENLKDKKINNIYVQDGVPTSEGALYILNSENITVCNINVNKTQRSGVYCRNVSNSELYNISVSHAGNYLIPQTGHFGVVLSEGRNNYAHDIYINDTGWSSLCPQGNENNTLFKNITVINSGHNGVDIHPAKNITIDNISIYNSVSNGILYTGYINGQWADHIILKNAYINGRGILCGEAAKNLYFENITTDSRYFNIIDTVNATLINVTMNTYSPSPAYYVMLSQVFGYPAQNCTFIDSQIPILFSEDAINTKWINSKYDDHLTMDDIAIYYYSDIRIVNSTGIPIKSAKVKFSNEVNSSKGSVNGNGVEKTEFTLTNGKTSLPKESRENCPAVPAIYYTNKTEIHTHRVEISTPNGNVTYKGIIPDSSWYRPNPNIPTYTITAIIPDNSTGPHITGFAPAKENPFNSGEMKNFRVWIDEPLTSMEWRVNGSSVLKGSLNYTWTVTDRNTTIEFIGSNSNGTVNHVWPLGESPDEPSVPDDNPAQEIKFSPSDSEITLNVSEKTVFSVSPDVFTRKEWYINGYPIQNDTTSMTRCWSTAGTHDVTFKGAGSGESVSHNWTVNVVEEKKNDEESTESIISITPEYQIVKPKQSFGLDITVDPSTSIIGTQLDFTFNSSMASANSASEGNLFKQKGASTFFNEGDINSSEGTIKHIYGLIIGTSNVSSPGTFATVNLTAGNRTGIAKFSLSNVLISDINSKSVPYTIANASILIDTAPVMNAICCPKSVDEKSNLAFKISAKDADGDRLTLSASGLPEGSSFNRTSGAFAWTPAVGQAGVYTITFKVSDGYLTDFENVTVTVNKLNNPPVINFFEPINGSSFSEGERIGISVNATDAEKQALNYSIKIDGVMYSSDPAYIWETDYSSSGNHTIEVSVSDGIDEAKMQHSIYISECHPRYDVNEDGVVNILDITNVSREYETTVSKPYPRYDTNQDGEINILDLTLVGHHFGEKVE
ncbi:putative Ig domain-containing protein [Methanosarcina mazei]|uniref:Dockerin domain-containing protein n=1 Tax=Methanosarcina mazei TaxID=2209 RepID=A0A0F8TX16_METMZ|nr:putative Ig domain-containing protein [Methanosarcina mazei]KKF99282.1 hypothetical protein DU47_20765 [Methanosarcina mazei]KKH83546.1 hypothetical protein DU80_00345 [Methanosarcina mazei]